MRGEARKYAPVQVEPTDGTNYTLQLSNRADSFLREQGNENYNVNIHSYSIYLSGMFHSNRFRTWTAGLGLSRLGVVASTGFRNSSGNRLSYSSSSTIFLFSLAGVYWQALEMHLHSIL